MKLPHPVVSRLSMGVAGYRHISAIACVKPSNNIRPELYEKNKIIVSLSEKQHAGISIRCLEVLN